jgi:polysaccharide export outer membrane protein
LAVADYQNYFGGSAPIAAAVRPVPSPGNSQSLPPVEKPPTVARTVEKQPMVARTSKRLDAVTPATPLKTLTQPAELASPGEFVFAPSAAPVRKKAIASIVEPEAAVPVAAAPIRTAKKQVVGETIPVPVETIPVPVVRFQPRSSVQKTVSLDVSSTTKRRSLIVAAPVSEPKEPVQTTETPMTREPAVAETETRVAERSVPPVASAPEAAPAREVASTPEVTPAPTPEVVSTPPIEPAPSVEPVPAIEPAPAVDPTPVVARAPEKVTQVTRPEPAAVNNEAMPAPAQINTTEVPEYPNSTMVAEGVRPPLTTSSFLPANPESYCFRCGVQCNGGCTPGGPGWWASRPIPWEVYAQGEYIGPARLAHVPIYRLRVDDRISFVFRLSGQVAGQPYKLNVRDHIQVMSQSAPEVVNRELIVQPDGTVTLPYLGQVRVAGSTIEDLTNQLDDLYKKHMKDPRISVTPLVLNSNLEELRMSVDRRYGTGGLGTDARVSPDGTVQLPAIGAVPAQGLTLDELEREVKTRYAMIVEGLEVTPILLDRAPRFLYVVGEVRVPGRFEMTGPTTVMQAIALAGSWNVGAQLDHVVIFRRDENWRLMATRVNVKSSLLFKKPCPGGEIWLRDSDIVLVPKSPILCADDVINLVFTRGIYGVFPMTAQLNFSKLSTL